MAGNSLIGALRVSLGLDSASFESGLKKARAELSGFSFNAKGAAIAGSAAGAAFALLAAAALPAARAAFAFADNIADTASRLSVSSKALQEYRFAVHQLGGDYEDADRALDAFQKKFGAAHAGLTKKAVAPFTALGLDPTAFASTEEALDAVVAKIANLKSAAEQAAIADKLGLDGMLPALRAGTAAINEAREAANRLGFVMDEALVEKGGEANDKIEDLERILDVQLNSALVELAPLILELGEGFVSVASSVAELARWLNALNEWAPSQQLLEFTSGSRSGGAQLGRLLGTDKFGQTEVGKAISRALGGQVDPSAPQVSSADMKRVFGSGTPATRNGELASPGGGGRRNDQSQAAIEAATRAQVQAQLALTEDLKEQAKLKEQQIDAELATNLRQLAEDRAQGQITAAAERIAAAKFTQAALDEKALLARETEAQMQERYLRLQEQIAGYYDQIASLDAGMAATAGERNAIELRALKAQQQNERFRLESDTEQQVLSGELTETQRQNLLLAQADLQAAQRRQQANEAQARVEREATDAAVAAEQYQIDQLETQAGLAQTANGRRAIELRILQHQQEIERLKLTEIANTRTLGIYSQEEIDDAKRRLEHLPEQQANERRIAEAGGTVYDAMSRAAGAFSSLRNAVKSRDWAAVFRALDEAIVAAKQAFAAAGKGAAGDIAATATIANAVGAAVGGKAGKALSGAASGALAGAQLGSIVPGVGTVIGAAAGAIIGGIAGVLNKKPSNHGALATINAGTVSILGDKRTDETENAARAAAGAYLDGVKALKATGITLKDTVTSFDIGTRDRTDIVLSSGKALTSAVGDAAAAADTALKALLEGASYASQAQEDLVKSMIAAGKGFDDITAALGEFAGAQGLQKQIGDAILELTDPKAYAISQLRDQQAAQRQQVQDAFDAGYLTTQQLEALNGQLSTLEGLQLDKTLKGFAEEAASVADQLSGVADAARGAVDDWESVRSSLEAYRRRLTQQDAGGTDPQTALANARAAFERARAASLTGDRQALADLPEVAQGFLDAAKANAPNAKAYGQALAEVKAAVTAASGFADTQADAALAQLVSIENSVHEVRDAILATANDMAGGFTSQDAQVAAYMAGAQDAASGQLDPTAGVGSNEWVTQALLSIASSTRKMASIADRQDAEGIYARGPAPGDPVPTAA